MFVVWFVVRYMYRGAISSYLTDKGRFEIFRLRDNLRRLEVTGIKSDFCFRFLEDVFNSAIRKLDRLSLGNFLLYKFGVGVDREAEREIIKSLERFDNEAPNELKELDNALVSVFRKAITVKSPGWWLIIRFAKLFQWSVPPHDSSYQDDSSYQESSRLLMHSKIPSF